MATIKFTSNADSGAGSLRQAIANAASGDAIAPDPDVFPPGSLITILLASRIEINGKPLTLDAGDRRVRLDGQETISCLYLRNGTISFTGFDFVRGYSSANGAAAATYTTNVETVVAFNRCLFAGNNAFNSGSCCMVGTNTSIAVNDCAAYGNYAGKGTFDFGNATTSVATFARSVFIGNCSAESSTGWRSFRTSPSSWTFVDCLIDAGTGSPTLTNSYRDVAVSNFANVPAFTSLDDWTATSWQSWNVRLVQESDYANGSTTSEGEFDFDGTPRRASGALGAYEVVFVEAPHAWLVYDSVVAVETGSAYEVVTEYIMMSAYYNRGETPVLFARIVDSMTTEPIGSTTVASIKMTVYKQTYSWGTTSRTPLTDWTNVDVPAESVLASLVTTDPRWTVDDVGYNFRYEPDTRTTGLFTEPGDYVVVVTINFAAGNPAPLVYEISIK